MSSYSSAGKLHTTLLCDNLNRVSIEIREVYQVIMTQVDSTIGGPHEALIRLGFHEE